MVDQLVTDLRVTMFTVVYQLVTNTSHWEHPGNYRRNSSAANYDGANGRGRVGDVKKGECTQVPTSYNGRQQFD